MVLRGPMDLVPADVPPPRPGAGDVLVRMTHSGICGTDFKIYNGSIPVTYPRVMGHEMVGHVAEVDGSGGGALRSGDRVVIDPQLYCGACVHCLTGETHLCPKGVLIGRDVNGGFSEYVKAPASHVFPLPASIDSRDAPLVQVLTTCVHAQGQSDVLQGESVVVYGLGVTGQLHVQLAKARGAGIVIGVTRSAAKRELARTLGADLTLEGGEATVKQIVDATDGRGADLVIETTGMLPCLSESINIARSGGRILLFGIITAREGALPFYDLYFKELALIGARVATPDDYPSSIALVEQGQVRLSPLVSHVLPLGEARAAIDMLGANDGQRMKIILDHS